MLRKLLLLWIAISFCSLFAFAQDSSKVDIFGGYQYLHANSGVSGVSGFSLNGWNASLNGYFTRNFGVTADFSGNYGTPSVLGTGVSTRFYTFLFGPTFRAPNSSHITPFAHALFGGGHISGAVGSLSASETDFTWAAGGGVDYDLSRNFAVRVAQADFLQTRVSGGNQNNFRFSAGIVIKF